MSFISKLFATPDCLNCRNELADNKRVYLSCWTALYAARRITKCKCVEECIEANLKRTQKAKEAYFQKRCLFDYALGQPIEHGCKYKDSPCEHSPSAIECYECFLRDPKVKKLVKLLEVEDEQ